MSKTPYKKECPACGGGPVYQDLADQDNKEAHCDDCGEIFALKEYAKILGVTIEEVSKTSKQQLKLRRDVAPKARKPRGNPQNRKLVRRAKLGESCNQ